jgi:FlaA1/EpsC-like NDP-sugar epimerase
VIQRRRQIQLVLQLAGDVLATAAAVLIAYWLRFEVEIQPVTKGVPPLDEYLGLIAVTSLLWPAVFYFQGLYQRRRIRSKADEAVRVAMAVLLATILLTAGLSFYRDFSYSRLFLAAFGAVDVVLVTGVRWSIAALLARIRRSGGNLHRVLVVGAGDLGRQVVERMQAHREYGFSVVGFLDDDPGKQQRRLHGAAVLGTTQELAEVVTEHRIDQVIIALPPAHRPADPSRRPAAAGGQGGAGSASVLRAAGGHRGPGRAAGYQPHSDSAPGVEPDRQAGLRHCRLGAAAARHLVAVSDHRLVHQA